MIEAMPGRSHPVRDAAEFGRVAVLFGGTSAEREISLQSGGAVLAALRARGVDAHALDPRDGVATLLQREFDRVFVALHGRGGEDGTIQGALQSVRVPYTGSGVLGSALAMDKQRTKLVWQAVGVPTPPFRMMRDGDDVDAIISALGSPLGVKPAHEGSSLGLSKVDDGEGLLSAWFEATRFDREVIIEPWISGHEYTCSMLHDRMLPTIRVETPHAFYDYEAKYADGAGTRYVIPCGLDAEHEAELQRLCLRAFDSIGVHGWGRIDLILDPDGCPWFLDINTCPGMTSHSLVPMAAAAVGIDFQELCWRILETSFR